MTIEGIDCAPLLEDDDLQEQFKGEIMLSIAEDLAVDKGRVDVVLVCGSVVAEVGIAAMPDEYAALNNRMASSKQRISRQTVKRLGAIDGIDKVSSGLISVTTEMEVPLPWKETKKDVGAEATGIVPMLVGAVLAGSVLCFCLPMLLKALCGRSASKPARDSTSVVMHAEDEDDHPVGAAGKTGVVVEPMMGTSSIEPLGEDYETDISDPISEPDREPQFSGRKVEAVLAKLLAVRGSAVQRRNLWSARRGYTVQISGDRLVWPDGTASPFSIESADEVSVEIGGEVHVARIDGDRLHWDEDVWTFIGEEPLDGFWRTASGSLVQISGNMISWTSGFRSWLMVKSSDEIAVELHNETFRAKLISGKLHWDDGDVWSRQNTHGLVLNLDDVRVGATLQVLEDSATVLGACHKAGLGTYKDEKRMALLGRTVQALKKEYYDGTVKCLSPDGNTVWFAVGALSLPQAPAALLRVLVDGQPGVSGEYMLEAVSSSSGMPIWKSMHQDYWLFTSLDGSWCLGDADAKANLRSGSVVNEQQHWGVMPHQIRSAWKRCEDGVSGEDLPVVITNVTQRSNTTALGVEHIDEMLQVLPPHASPDVPEEVWKRWAKKAH